MAKRKNLTDLRQKKRNLWLERTAVWSRLSFAKVEKLLLTPRTQSFRINPLTSGEIADELLARAISWCPNGFEIIPEFTADYDALAADGQIYIQNAASWLPVLALDPRPDEHILDVCAAPGGKSSHIQAITTNNSQLICNDNSKPRLHKLQANMQRLGAQAEYLLADATRLSRHNLGEFDKILLDAPCSGEGLMTLRSEDAKLFDSWSVAHIRRLSDLQKRLILEAWRLLKPGGTLVYSTCTMAPEENEAVVDYLLRRTDDAELTSIDVANLPNRMPAVQTWNDRDFSHDLSPILRLAPDRLTEAFFIAKIHKKLSSLKTVKRQTTSHNNTPIRPPGRQAI